MQSENAPAVKTVGGFEILAKIGQGAMGTVFKARQPGLDRVVALKVLPPKIASTDPAFIDRFIREARVSAKLNHPNIVQGIEVGQDGPTRLYYFAMEYIDGPTVRQVLNWEKRIEERRALEIALGVAHALVCSHRAGIVHRDIKPDNILLASNGDIKVTDLGLARSVSMGSGIRFNNGVGDTDESQIIMGPSADAALTVVGAAIGTPSYMAPEAARAREVDIRTDIYGVGATLYHMLTGGLPFKGANAEETMKLLVTSPVPDPRKVNSSIRAETAELVMKLMQKDPSKRLQTPEELVDELEHLLREPEAEREAVRTSNSSIPRARRTASKVPLRTPKSAASSTKLAVIACVVAFVVGAAGIWLLARNNHSGTDKNVADNSTVPPVPPVKSDSEKSADKHEATGTATATGTGAISIEPTAPPRMVETHPPTPVSSQPPLPPGKSIDDLAFDVWETLVESTHFREAASNLQSFCLEHKLNDTASRRLHSKMEEAVAERLKRLVAHARTLVDAGRGDEAVRELTCATFGPGEEDPLYRGILEEARFAVPKTGSPLLDVQNKWLSDLRRAQRDGAKKLADGREFVVKTTNGEPYHLGKGRDSFKGLAGDDAAIMIATTDEAKLVPQFTRIPFEQMTVETRMELSNLSTDDKAALAVLQVKWAAIRATVFNSMSIADALSALSKAKADGAPESLLTEAKLLLASGANKTPPADTTSNPSGPAPAISNPFIKAKAGDFVEYKNGNNITRMKVLKKDASMALFKMMDIDEQGKIVREQSPNSVPLGRNVEFYDMFCPGHKILSECEETLTIGDRNYKCRCVTVKFNDPGTHNETTAKLWFCPDVPIFGLVRWQVGNVGMELKRFGNE